jgi:addiction module HigA family antidote
MLRKREPTSPGEILFEEFLKPLGLTQRQLADHLGCDVKVINRIINGRTGVTPEMALKLGAAFQTSPEFWLNAQNAVDLHRAAKVVGALPDSLLRAGNYTEERRSLLPEWDASTLVREARKLREPREPGT